MSDYVDKAELYNQIVVWQDAAILAKSEGRESPLMPNAIGIAIIEMAEGMALRHNFRDYSWIDEMIGDGIEAATRAIPKFDRAHPKKNAFGFLNFIIWRAFVNRLKEENAEHANRMELMLDANFEAYEGDGDITLDKSAMIGLYTLNE